MPVVKRKGIWFRLLLTTSRGLMANGQCMRDMLASGVKGLEIASEESVWGCWVVHGYPRSQDLPYRIAAGYRACDFYVIHVHHH